MLVLAVGGATRLLPYLPNDDKTYVFDLRVGMSTDTGDATGRCTRRADVGERWHEPLERVVASLVGDLVQTAPLYSAVKVDGRPLYHAARKGVDVRRPERTIRIEELRVLGVEGSAARMRVTCSAGTYVRTLCEQIGERLGLPAHMGFLLRTRAGPFGLAAARTPQAIARDPQGSLTDPLDVLELPRIEIDDLGASRFAHGNDVVRTDAVADTSATTALILHRGSLMGVATVQGATIAPLRVLAAAGENG